MPSQRVAYPGLAEVEQSLKSLKNGSILLPLNLHIDGHHGLFTSSWRAQLRSAGN